jgi:hypothetical protein
MSPVEGLWRGLGKEGQKVRRGGAARLEIDAVANVATAINP